MTYADENGFHERNDDETYTLISDHTVTDSYSDICQCNTVALKYKDDYVELESVYFVNDENGGVYWGTVRDIDPHFGDCKNELDLVIGDEISFEEYHVLTCTLRDA